MFELILSAIVLGFMLSLVFIGPIFFLLIETSFSRGPKHALALDLGVISADLLHFGSVLCECRYCNAHR
jgi:threonine/homoserine/homoserine lactone efflux protein